MEETRRICCVTGHRPQSFPWEYTGDPAEMYDFHFESVIERTVEKLINDGYNHFICGGAIGVDTVFALAVLHLRDLKYPHITLEVAVPCPAQDKKWNPADKRVYKEIITLADEVNLISEHYTKFCFHKRNEYMVNKSELVLAVWNGEKKGGTYYTYQYALRHNKNIKLIMLQDIMTDADECEAMNIAWQTQKYGQPLPEVDTPEWDAFVEEALKKPQHTDSAPLKKTLEEIAIIKKRREKYYKQNRPLP